MPPEISEAPDVRIGLVGYERGGRYFHAPVIEAAASGARLGVYQNRRWDTNIATLGTVLAEGRLGPVHSQESVFNQNDPRSVESASSGGTMLGLGSHLVDQALWLFGPVDNVAADMTWSPTS